MIDSLLTIDTQLFLLINNLPHNFFLDWFFIILTVIGSEGIIWFIIAFFVFLKRRKAKEFYPFILAFVIEQLAEIFIKDLLKRPRPQFSLPLVNVPFDFIHTYSFPSGHTMLAFALAYVLGKLGKFGKWGRFGLYVLAFLIAFSRIYLGKHYPSDVLAGAILGLLIGFVSFRLIVRMN